MSTVTLVETEEEMRKILKRFRQSELRFIAEVWWEGTSSSKRPKSYEKAQLIDAMIDRCRERGVFKKEEVTT